jgi:hypothetical protein
MSRKQYELNFSGYWREPNIGGIPAKSGVYCVYVCTFDETAKTVSLKQIVYIGAATNAREAVANHQSWPEWKKYLTSEQQLCVSFAPIDEENMERVAAALIYEHKPPANHDFTDKFPFAAVAISTSGRSNLLKQDFNVSRVD